MKIDWEKGARLFNQWRVVPRILVLAASIYIGIYSWWVTGWYMNLPEHTLEVSGFVGAVVTLLGAILKKLIDTYINTGGNNDE